MAMASKRAKSAWACTECGAAANGWFGKCPACGAWNTIEPAAPAPARTTNVATDAKVRPAPSWLEGDGTPDRIATGIDEVDRVLGGGIVPESLTLVGGPPGIGKSTLMLQLAAGVAAEGPVLYASGEESGRQVALRAQRLGAEGPHLHVLADQRCDALCEAARTLGPRLVVADSIQTMVADDQTGIPGGMGQVRAVLDLLAGLAKSARIPVMLVGHVTKDGQLAGPKVLEHMVDVVLAFDGDEDRALRILRATKNRYGSTREIGIFEMTEAGLVPVADPSADLANADRPEAPGACVFAMAEGGRAMLVEVQALVAPAAGGPPRRTCTGVDANRVAMLLAVLERHGGLDVLGCDVFANVAGGLRLREPAADLPLLLALASSHLGRPLPRQLAAFGEVGLTGEIRRVPLADARIAEATRLGRTTLVVPRQTAVPEGASVQVVEVATAREALEAAFG
ncbi:MAG: DNA repair protein RadA [Deltaproteobacteria bacterium]|nr:MAG: DNA repair protein RadA [Deltaproteobacteria bacterium]